MSNKKTKCGVIGLGWWGTQMSENIVKSGNFEISIVHDTNIDIAEKFVKKNGGRIASSTEEVVNANIECVFIFSPNQFHLQHCILAAKAKKHIFLEKPIANTSKEGEAIIDACKKNGVTLAIAHNVRYYNIFKKVKEMIAKGTVGDIVYIESNRSRPIGFGIDENSWRFYEKSCNGGPLMQMAIHLLDTIHFITNDSPKKIHSLTQKRFLKTENPESFSVNIEMKSGAASHVFTSYVLPESFYINIFGTRGAIFADPFNGLYVQKQKDFQKMNVSFRQNSPELDEIKEFHKAIKNKSEFTNPSPDEALENVKIVEQILKSS